MRLIDADKLKLDMDCNIDFGSLYNRLIVLRQIDDAPTVQQLIIPVNPTNGDVLKAIFPNMYSEECDYDIFTTLDGDTRFTYDWWNAPYKRGAENG